MTYFTLSFLSASLLPRQSKAFPPFRHHLPTSAALPTHSKNTPGPLRPARMRMRNTSATDWPLVIFRLLCQKTLSQQYHTSFCAFLHVRDSSGRTFGTSPHRPTPSFRRTWKGLARRAASTTEGLLTAVAQISGTSPEWPAAARASPGTPLRRPNGQTGDPGRGLLAQPSR